MNTKNTLESLQEDGNRSNIEPDKSNEDHEEKANINNNNPEDDSKVDTDAVQIQVEQQNSKEKGNQVNLNTLDESVWETLVIVYLIKKRDLKRILHKIEYVLLPRFSAAKGKELQNWDMWGPLLMCVTLCV